MKKILSLVLLTAMLFLVSCGSVPAETTVNTSSTTSMVLPETTNGTIISNETTVPNETTLETAPAAETTTGIITPPIPTEKKLYSPTELAYSYFFETNSRILFASRTTGYNYYYSKADSNVYYFCFDPLCEHIGPNRYPYSENCPAVYTEMLHNNAIIVGERIYYRDFRYNRTSPNYIMYSCSFDGADVRREFSTSLGSALNVVATDRYIYVATSGTDSLKIVRYDTQQQLLEDFSSKVRKSPNGLYMEFYNLYIYGDKLYFFATETDTPIQEKSNITEGHYYEANLDFSDIKESILSEQLFNVAMSYGVVNGSKICTLNSRETKGKIYTYDIETGERTEIVVQNIGFNEIHVSRIDQEYIYFVSMDNETVVNEYSNTYGGKHYRMKFDGSDLILVSNRPDLYFQFPEIYFWQDKVFFLAALFQDTNGTIDNIGKENLYVATIGEDGKWLNATAVEVIG